MPAFVYYYSGIPFVSQLDCIPLRYDDGWCLRTGRYRVVAATCRGRSRASLLPAFGLGLLFDAQAGLYLRFGFSHRIIPTPCRYGRLFCCLCLLFALPLC